MSENNLNSAPGTMDAEQEGQQTKTYPQPVLPLMESKSVEAQKLLSKDWNELSSTERETIHDEVNGVAGSSRAIAEDPKMIERSLQQMEQEIGHVRRLRSSYDRAMFLAPHRIKDKDFRLLFLRAENFDTYRATQRFMKHFEYKNTLFGYEKLVETIRLDDLDENDTEAYLSGTFQVLSSSNSSSFASKRSSTNGSAAGGDSSPNGNKKKGEDDKDNSKKSASTADASSRMKKDQHGRPVTWFAPHLGQFQTYQSMVSQAPFSFYSFIPRWSNVLASAL